MPRRSSGGRSSSGGFGFGRSRAAPNRSAAAAAPPRTSAAPHSSTSSRPGMMSGMGGVMLQGMAFGAGSEVAHQAVRGMMGSGHDGQQGAVQGGTDYAQGGSAQPLQDPCSGQNYDFMQCLQTNPEHIGTCQSYLDLYKQCRQVQQ